MIERARVVRRLWRPRTIAGIAAPLALALVVADVARQLHDVLKGQAARFEGAIYFALILFAALLAVYAVRTFVRALNDFLDDYLGLARARSLALFSSVVLYAIIVLFVVGAIGHNLGGVLVGGAVTGVIVGIAGQASLSNVIAGLVILFARPYSAGMYVTTRAATFGGVEYSGQVWDISLFYTTLHAGELEVRIPNNAMINAVVVRRPREYEVSIPVTLPKATADVPAALGRLRAAVAEGGQDQDAAAPRVTLDGVTDVGYVVGVRLFVADDAGRQAVEDAVATVVADLVAAVAAPDDRVDGGAGVRAAGPDAGGAGAGVAEGDGRGQRAAVDPRSIWPPNPATGSSAADRA